MLEQLAEYASDLCPFIRPKQLTLKRVPLELLIFLTIFALWRLKCLIINQVLVAERLLLKLLKPTGHSG